MGKFIDLTGQVFGRLTVLERDFTKNSKDVYWKCQCECGNISSTTTSRLRSGKAKSCGCLRKELNQVRCKGKYKDLTNKRFGKLLALELDLEKTTAKNKTYWKCQCDCGNIISVRQDALGISQLSCGCLIKETNIIDIANQRFGKLVALYPTDEHLGNVRKWHCKCDCGNECNISGQFLRNGLTRSCGCESKSIGETNIGLILKENNIKFETEKTFKDCINPETGGKLRYDFYLPDYNRLIEFDGRQHFSFKENWGYQTEEDFKKLQQRDEIKNQYAKAHKIQLIRIPYWRANSIDLEIILNNKYLV